MNSNDKTLIIIPAYNEEGSIAKVITEIQQIDTPVDILVVNDGSKDRTAEVATSCGVAVLSAPYNQGIGATVQTGFKYAARSGYDYAIQLDGDGQHIAAEIPKILSVAQAGEADMVIGSRYIGEKTYKTPLMRRLGMLIISTVNSLVTGQKVTDNTSGFRAFNKSVINYLANYYPSDYPEPEVVVILSRKKFKIKEVPVQMRFRESGESSISSIKSIYYMIKVLLAIFVDLFKSYPDKK
ncbi:MAG: glycosyltransferase family 2 protein [Deferribacteres bacterium]|nr:glycosyltransferase family 2 protein [candidate division KSB1 bacterium]MCB9503369.1 glycosyltransferase family 2 protein [Deferribacteres bacterium]